MSIESMTVAFHHSRAKGTTKLVLLGIANHDGDGGAWPSVATLTKYANASERTVQYAITSLIELGEIRRHFQDGGRAATPDHLRPNLYEITLRCPPGCDRSANHNVMELAPVTFEPAANGEVISGPWMDRGEAGCTPPGETGCTPPGEAGCTQTVLTEPSKKSPVDRAKSRSRPEAMITDKQKRYIRHMQETIGGIWSKFDDPETMSCAKADGWIDAYMGDYRKAGGGQDRHTEVWSDDERRNAAF